MVRVFERQSPRERIVFEKVDESYADFFHGHSIIFSLFRQRDTFLYNFIRSQTTFHN